MTSSATMEMLPKVPNINEFFGKKTFGDIEPPMICDRLYRARIESFYRNIL